ncbi:DUF926-domain-containing protein [Meira miltonrushii]|uniref:DUF926-domain-containing protein n=1 Tax=Meira miltonrushii TaxID=1280837 RepID=A0A316VHS5_9BASI|nr:DUF926-domain-containing protein [Meira miltonrushii]PWN37142.1 DUF926-domain-containing protein [Meira miltonrushii]
MASVHPSRSGLVPQSDSSDRANDDREKDLRQRLYESRGNQAGGSRQTDRQGDRNDQGRASPSYQPFDSNFNNDEEYRSHGNRQRYYEDRRYDNSNDRNGAPPPGAWGRRERGQYQDRAMTGDSFLQSRQEQRKASTVSIWPPSPTSPYREKEEEDEKSRKKSSSRHKESSHKHSKRRSHHSSRHRDDYSDSEEEREGRRRHKRKESERDRSSRHRSSSPSGRRKYDDNSEDEYERQRRRRKEKERRRERDYSDEDRHRSRHHRSESRRTEKEPAPEAHVSEKGKNPASSDANTAKSTAEPDAVQSSSRKIGPQLPQAAEADNPSIETLNARAYGGALLPGEGSAMANFVQEGKRIPRRGEIGLSSDQIEAYEKAGFVMSGSRHNRMNAVRMRKENQVYTAEEQRSMLKLIAEEKQKKEAALVEQFKEMVDSIGDD